MGLTKRCTAPTDYTGFCRPHLFLSGVSGWALSRLVVTRALSGAQLWASGKLNLLAMSAGHALRESSAPLGPGRIGLPVAVGARGVCRTAQQRATGQPAGARVQTHLARGKSRAKIRSCIFHRGSACASRVRYLLLAAGAVKKCGRSGCAHCSARMAQMGFRLLGKTRQWSRCSSGVTVPTKPRNRSKMLSTSHMALTKAGRCSAAKRGRGDGIVFSSSCAGSTTRRAFIRTLMLPKVKFWGGGIASTVWQAYDNLMRQLKDGAAQYRQTDAYTAYQSSPGRRRPSHPCRLGAPHKQLCACLGGPIVTRAVLACLEGCAHPYNCLADFAPMKRASSNARWASDRRCCFSGNFACLSRRSVWSSSAAGRRCEANVWDGCFEEVGGVSSWAGFGSRSLIIRARSAFELSQEAQGPAAAGLIQPMARSAAHTYACSALPRTQALASQGLGLGAGLLQARPRVDARGCAPKLELPRSPPWPPSFTRRPRSTAALTRQPRMLACEVPPLIPPPVWNSAAPRKHASQARSEVV